MTREGFAAALCAAILIVPLSLALPFTPSAVADEDRDRKIADTLAVQTALQQAREETERGNPGTAVHVLEAQLSRINGNRVYLAALRDAYRAYVRELLLAHRESEAKIYLRRLEYLDPGARLDFDAEVGKNASPPPDPDPTPGTAPAKPPGVPPAPKPSPAAVDPAPPDHPARPAAAPKPPYVARGVREDTPARRTDPLASDNELRPAPAPANPVADLLSRADREWGERNYAAAARLYEQAHQADRRSTASCQERWAYCKLHEVLTTLRATSGSPPYARLEEEVRTAMSLSPRLEDQGKELLAYIQERRDQRPPKTEDRSDAPLPAIRHQGQAANGWATAETPHFRIFHDQTREYAEQVARLVEQTRTDVNRRWFNDDGESWGARCDLYLHASADKYAQATGKPTSWPGHSTIRSEGGRVLSRRIDVRYDHGDVLTSTLPHEATHVVLAGRFGGADLPRWADEGMALLTEPRGSIDKHLRTLPRHRDEGTLFPVRELIALTDYPERQRVGAFYAQSVSLTQFLVDERGPLTFTRFLQEVLRYGADRALKQQYGYDLATLEQRWFQSAFKDSASQAANGQPGH